MPQPPTFNATLMGCNMSGFAAYSDGIPDGAQLTLEREPQNEHDANAIRVLHDGYFIGRIDRETAADLAWWIDRGQAFESILVNHTGGPRRKHPILITPKDA